MAVNAHVGAENGDAEVRRVLDRHHQQLRDALLAALRTARARGQLAADADLTTVAEVLAMLAYGVNLRSRAGADAPALQRTVSAALAALGGKAG
jgi:TetR/AcrR family transcriptional regulator, transcriptional repressor for nem operon